MIPTLAPPKFRQASALLSAPCHAAGGKNKMTLPDFTKGDAIPEGANHDWTLGATGVRGWMFSEKMSTTGGRQIAITKVEKSACAMRACNPCIPTMASAMQGCESENRSNADLYGVNA